MIECEKIDHKTSQQFSLQCAVLVYTAGLESVKLTLFCFFSQGKLTLFTHMSNNDSLIHFRSAITNEIWKIEKL